MRPATAELTALGTTVQLTAEVRNQWAGVMAGTTVIWGSSDTSVATVDALGLVTGVGAGMATITVTAGSIQGTAEITVAPPSPPLVVTMAPQEAEVSVGGSADFDIIISGGEAGAVASWTCTSSGAGVAAAAMTSAGCRATGVAVGVVTIVAGITKGSESATVGAQITVTTALSHGCPVDSPMWMGLPVCEEGMRIGYDRDDFGSAYGSLEDEIIASLPKLGTTQVYTPYTCTLYDIRPDGTAATDIDHIVALVEAYDSGLPESKFREFGGDIENLTIAQPNVNRIQKGDRDAGEWRPAHNGGWYAARIVAVKQKYGLSVNSAERDALQSILDSDPTREVTCSSS